MPKGRGYGRKRYGRRYKKRSKLGYKRRGAITRINSPNQGYININRRLPEIAVSCSTLEGLPVKIDPTGSCLTLGTPTLTPGGLGNTYDVPFSMLFRADQIVSINEFAVLFDNYKINGVKVQIRSFANQDSVGGFPMPWIEHWNDQDSAVPPTAALAREIMGVKHKYFNAMKNVASMYVKPRALMTVGTSNIPASLALGRKTWLDCSALNVPHYAIKGIIHNYTLSAVQGLNRMSFDVTVNASFKDVQ